MRWAVMTVIVGVALGSSWSSAGAATAPMIVRAVMVDRNGDVHADQVKLTYDQPVYHSLDSDGSYPFSVAGYVVIRVGAASGGTTIVLTLKHLRARDILAAPSVTYTPTASDPVTGAAVVEASAQTFSGTASLASHAWFVAPGGADTSTCGALSSPCASIGQGTSRAVAAHKTQVYVAGGTYAGPLTLADGVSVFGGFDSTFGPTPTGDTTAVVNGGFDATRGLWATLVAVT